MFLGETLTGMAHLLEAVGGLQELMRLFGPARGVVGWEPLHRLRMDYWLQAGMPRGYKRFAEVLGEDGCVGDFVTLRRFPDHVYMREDIGDGNAVGEEAGEAVGLNVPRKGAHLLLLGSGAGD